MGNKYHVNWKGEPGGCSAKPGNCPFGGEDDHFDSPEAARSAYEKIMESQAAGGGLKKVVPVSETTMLEIVNRETGKVESTIPIGNNERSLPGYVEHLEKGYADSPWKARRVGGAVVEPTPAPAAASAPVSKPAPAAKKTAAPKKRTPAKPAKSWKDYEYIAPEDSKVVAAPKTQDPYGGYMGGSLFVGGKVGDNYIPQKEAAKNIRSDIKAALKAGELPTDLAYNVRMNSGAWVSSITILMSKKNEAGASVPFSEMEEGDERVLAVKKYLDKLGNQYASKDVNSHYDYFNTSNSATVRFKTKWDN